MYDVLAEVYDQLQDVDYEAFADYYEAIFQKFNCQPSLVLDLGCGTGNMTLAMARRGYEMIGLDCSVEMLEIAAQKARDQQKEILFLNQDMTTFELYGTVGAMICALDGVNYLTGDGQLEEMLQRLHCFLDPGGLLIFDVNTPYKFQKVLDGQTFLYDQDDIYCVWNNEYDAEEQICYFDLNIFLRDADGMYIRRDEFQEERAYSALELQECIERCGLECAGIFDHLSFLPPKTESERLFFVVRRPLSAAGGYADEKIF
ncbi:class I SAM-dependent methyltransferase [Oscillospiraceae bacterium DSM 107454]|uniref:Class I SAM-dependent methyltransferase n=2 Tax=Ructibacterium gallinarum TaxID=2779355 RepID=A0A9D5LZC1_9FIRM|nr:class I SAM-dependent methyltransferase [Ructibacterium gallinarum]